MAKICANNNAKNLAKNERPDKNLAWGKPSSETWHRVISLHGDLTKARNRENQEVNFWPRFVPITCQEISRKRMTSENLSTTQTKLQNMEQDDILARWI